jgi:hypothetical protein
MAWLSRQFSTRVIVLIPVAIAINIVLGFTVQKVLNLPIYLDSIGTILVGVLAGPIAGAVTGAASNLIWQYAPVIGPGSNIGPFAITSVVIGLLAGLWGWLGVYRSRPAQGARLWLAVAIGVGVIAILVYPIVGNPAYTDPNIGGYPAWVFTATIVIAVIFAIVLAGVALGRRDTAGVWVALAGAVTGIAAAFVSAPIAAIVYEGVTGSGTDLIVAALRQGGADVFQASLGQGLFSDPIDKTISSYIVFLVLLGLSSRVIARFPNGERLLGTATD